MATKIFADKLTQGMLNAGVVPADIVADVNTGSMLSPGMLPATYGYTGDLMTSVTVGDGANTWVMTNTYDGSNLAATSGWVKQ